MSLIGRASALLLGDPIAAPGSLAAADPPPEVRFRRGRLVPWIGGVLARMSAPAAAVTLGRTIIVDPEATLTPDLIAHELTHVRQWRADPLFPLRYTIATLRHGYYNNPYEVEARLAADAFRVRTAAEGAARYTSSTNVASVGVDGRPPAADPGEHERG